jgi:hypothetical protein
MLQCRPRLTLRINLLPQTKQIPYNEMKSLHTKTNCCGQSFVCVINQADDSMLPLMGIIDAEKFVSTVQDRMIMMSSSNSGRGTTDNDIDQTV